MSSIRIHDDRGHALTLRTAPRRIVSLVPSETYSVIRLGAGDRLVGRTRYCVAPAADVERIEVVGGTKDCDVERVLAIAPDLVLANQEENTRADIVRLEERAVPVLVSFPRTFAQGVGHLARLALALGLGGARDRGSPDAADASPAEAMARELVAHAYRCSSAAEARRRERPPLRVFVPIWMDPLMTVSGETFISDMLDLVGAENVFAGRQRRYPLAADLGKVTPLSPERVGDRDVRYPRVTLDEVAERQPDLVLLPDEPHAFTEEDAAVFRGLDMPAARAGQVVHCDGKDLMWPGARSLEGVERLRALVDAARPPGFA